VERQADPGRAIAFVGLGNMGLPMALRLAAAGHTLTGYDVSDAVRDAAVASGLDVATSLRDAARDSAIAILMLPSSDVVDDVVLAQSLADALPSGALVVDMSSSDPLRTRALATVLAERGLRLVDAPVSGGVVGAVEGRLTIMLGGAEVDAAEVEPLLAELGSSRRTGAVGSGHAVKALNNLLSATHLLVSSEAIEAGRRFGLADDVMLDVINSSSGRSFSTEYKWPVFVVPETFDSGFGLRLLVKDARTATTLARALGLPSRLGEAALALWEQAAQELPADADHTEIAKFAAVPDEDEASA